MTPTVRTGLLSSLLLVSAVGAPAQAQQEEAACTAPEHRQFDFWIGRWEVHNPDGEPVGRNRIEPIHGGCALRENWTGRSGVTGSSQNVYDPSTRTWHQTWVDSQGTLLLLDGGLDGDAMVLEGTTTGDDGGTVNHRITWTPTGAGHVRQLWQISRDDGQVWTTIFDGRYERKEP